MQKTLGILVNSDRNFNYIYEIAKAAKSKNITTYIFFTGRGVLLSKKEEFKTIVGQANLRICEVSYRANGLKGEVPGVGFKEFTTQAANAKMVEECDRYIVL
jgi:predicted peroxiredoxin